MIWSTTSHDRARRDGWLRPRRLRPSHRAPCARSDRPRRARERDASALGADARLRGARGAADRRRPRRPLGARLPRDRARPPLPRPADPPRRREAGAGGDGRGRGGAQMSTAVLSPRGWWRREPVAPGQAAPLPDSQLAFGALIGFTFILLLAPQMMVPALSALAFIRPALFAVSAAAVSYLANRFLTGRPFTVITPELC